MNNLIYRYIEFLKKIEKQNQEILWARIWDDTCRDKEWIKGLPGIFPGRCAVGYNYIYIMTRILDSVEPHAVLDLGLGISSTLISAWFKHSQFEDGCHTIVEQDTRWANFYLKKNKLSPCSKLIITECVEKKYKGNIVNAYKDFKKNISGKQYNVISIDGPWGSGHYSRRDIVPLLPDILTKDFVIIMDDSNRIGEKETIEEIINVLEKNGIKTEIGLYHGETDCTLICSSDYKFLCTL